MTKQINIKYLNKFQLMFFVKIYHKLISKYDHVVHTMPINISNGFPCTLTKVMNLKFTKCSTDYQV